MNLVSQIVALLLSMLSKDQAKELLDKMFDFIEDKVAETENKWDDTLILPLVAKAREALDVPDNDA